MGAPATRSRARSACSARFADSRASVSTRLRSDRCCSGTGLDLLRMVLPPADPRGDADEHELGQQPVVRQLGDGHEDADVGPEGRGRSGPERGAEQRAAARSRSSASAGNPCENIAYQMRPWVPIGGEWSADSGAP